MELNLNETKDKNHENIYSIIKYFNFKFQLQT